LVLIHNFSYIDNTSSPHHNPQSQTPIPNITSPLSFGDLVPQIPGDGQYVFTESGTVGTMSTAQSAFMDRQMAYMLQEMEAEFGDDDDDNSETEVKASSQSRETIELEGSEEDLSMYA
jgi:hypothetical protein